MNNKRQWNWLIPFALLCLLIVLYFNRWDYVAGHSGVVKYKVDRWTGQHWVEKYRTKYTEKPITPSTTPYKNRQIATGVWVGLTGLTIIWLLRTAQVEPLARFRKHKEKIPGENLERLDRTKGFITIFIGYSIFLIVFFGIVYFIIF